MLPPPFAARAALPLAAVLSLLLPIAACSPAGKPVRGSATWISGRTQPAFDPDDAPDALRWSLERLLSRGLVERDSSGRVVAALADSMQCSRDSLTWTFKLPRSLRFTDGSPVTSAHFRDALQGGLAREDQATRAWLLMAVRGVRKVRPGKPLPALGIETPDDCTLVLRLETPDRRLLEKLSVPGVSTPWKRRGGSWRDAVGVGPYRVLDGKGAHSLTLVAASPAGGARASVDTLVVRFITGAGQVRNILRRGAADLLWPLPAGKLEEPYPEGWSLLRHQAIPARRLLLILRADVPPLTLSGPRQALTHALNREELLEVLGARGEPLRRWLPGAREPYAWPLLETRAERAARRATEFRERPEQGARPESYHVVLAYDADLAGAAIARTVQGQWARAGNYGDLRPLHGEAVLAEALGASAAQAQLVESQALLTGPEAELALFVMPVRGPAVGAYRTGWRTREFDRWVAQPEPAPGLDADAVQAVLAQARIVLPVAGLPWLMAVRNAGILPIVHVAYGPDWTRPESAAPGVRSR